MKQILNGKVLAAMLVIASLLLCGSLAYIFIARPAASHPDPEPATGILTVIAAPTSTPGIPPATLTPIPPTPAPTYTPAPGQIAAGVYVQIHDTGVEGLNIRSEPGLASDVIFSGYDSEVFLVTDGPREADGYTWWYLTASYDTTRFGWAAQDFLEVVETP